MERIKLVWALSCDWLLPAACRIKAQRRVCAHTGASEHRGLLKNATGMEGKEALILSDSENKEKIATHTGVTYGGSQPPPPVWKMAPTVHRRTGFGIQELLGLNKEPAATPRRPLEALPHRTHVLAGRSALGHGGLGVGLLGPEGIHSIYCQPAFMEVLSEAQNVQRLQPLHRVTHMDAQMDAHNSASSGECLCNIWSPSDSL